MQDPTQGLCHTLSSITIFDPRNRFYYLMILTVLERMIEVAAASKPKFG
jgi:hypothetical protein